jgi:replicative DNA helicase
MNLQKVLLGALLIKPELAPYALPNLEIEHFPADLQPVFAAISGLWKRWKPAPATQSSKRSSWNA